MKKTIIAVQSILMLALATPSRADSTPATSASPAANAVSGPVTISGTVQSVDASAGQIQVEDNEGSKVFTVGRNTQVERNGESVDFASIKTGDSVTLEVAPNDQATYIKVGPYIKTIPGAQ
jgi:hypothetical protein